MIPQLSDFFDLQNSLFTNLFVEGEAPWLVLPRMGLFLQTAIHNHRKGTIHSQAVLQGDIEVGEGTVIDPNAFLLGPIWIGENCHIGPGSFLRGPLIIGSGSRIGHAVELKNSLLLGESSVPHLSYVGDSVIGYKAHLGAGVKVSNHKLDGSLVRVKPFPVEGKTSLSDDVIDTDLRKLGAIIGDSVEIGCNSVLNPGTLIGHHSRVYAGALLRGSYAPRSLVRVLQTHEISELKSD